MIFSPIIPLNNIVRLTSSETDIMKLKIDIRTSKYTPKEKDSGVNNIISNVLI